MPNRGTTTSAPTAHNGRSRLTQLPNSLWKLPFLVPAVVATLVFVAYPTIQVARLSLEDGARGEKSLGLANYRTVISDSVFVNAIMHSLVLAVVTSLGTVAIGTAIALAVHARPLAHRWIRSAIFLPVILPGSAISLAWRQGLDPYFGWANSLVSTIRPDLSRAWLGQPHTALLAVIFVCILQSAGFPMVVVAGALRRIPVAIEEAARLDGATGWRLARLIRLPLIQQTTSALILIQFLFGFFEFDHVYVMTNGGPGTSSEVLNTYIYHRAFVSHQPQEAAAASVLAFALIAPLCVWYARRLSRTGTAPTPAELESADVTRPQLAPTGRRWSRATLAVPLIAWALVALSPVLVVISSSLRTTRDLLSKPVALPSRLFGGNYLTAWSGPNFGQPVWRYLENSGVAVGLAVVIAIGLGAPAGHMLSGRGLPVARGYFLLLLIVPAVLTWIPLFQLASTTHALNQPAFLGLAYGALQVPLVVILLRSFFAGHPPEISEAARTDGASEWRLFRSIVLPMSGRPIVLVCALTGVALWNELGLATVLLLNSNSQTLPVGVSLFGGQYSTDLGAQYAALTLALLPILLVYLLAQKYVADR